MVIDHITTEELYRALPTSEAPIKYSDLCKQLGPPYGTQIAASVRAGLQTLRNEGRAHHLSGLGWYRPRLGAIPAPRQEGSINPHPGEDEGDHDEEAEQVLD